MDNDILSILLIEDNPGDARLMRHMLEQARPEAYPAARSGFHLECVKRLSTGLQHLEQVDVDLVLLDLSLPDSKGLDTFYAVQDQAPHLPIVVLTGLDDERIAIQAIRSGAQDYLIKGDVDSNLLVRSIYYAVERNQAEQALRRYGQEQAALYAVTSAASALLDPNELLEAVLDVVLPLLGSKAGWVTIPGPSLDDKPTIAAWRGITESLRLAETSGPMRNCPICSQLLAGGEMPIDPQLLRQCPRLPQVAIEESNLYSHVGIPLTAGDQVLGILEIAWPEPHHYTESDRNFLRVIGQQVGMALHNAHLYQAALQVDRLQIINDLDRALTASLEPNEVAEITLRRISAALNAPKSTLLLCSPELDAEPRQLFPTKLDTPVIVGPAQKQELDHLLSLAQEQGVLPLPLEKQSLFFPNPTETAQESAGLAVPLRSEQGITGILLLGGRLADHPFNEQDRALALAASGRAGQALQNARLYDTLRHLLREREQAQAQLIHSEKMAALGRLMASIAHEINNPLQSVEGCLTLTMEEWAGQQRRQKIERYLEIISTEIDRVSDIVGRMRDFYRPASPGFQAIDLHRVLESVLELVGKQLQHSNIMVARDWSPELPQIEANPDHLKQVFLNLILNAIDTLPEGGQLDLCTTQDELSGLGESTTLPAVRVEFRDNGIGMPKDVLAHIFEPFFTTKEYGSGLGLSISYNIIKAHNGQIWAESQAGQGANFIILLPVKQSHSSRV